MTKGPYKAAERNGYWVCVDTRTGEPVSYPASKATARTEAAIMNRAYADALASQVAA